MKLGAMLVDRGLINERQLAQALAAQVIYGGQLGTCLFEQGAIDEASLGQVLAEASGLPLAFGEMFHDIPRGVIESIPGKLAEKHRVVPVRRQEKTLSVAMVDAKDLRVLDELSFASGCAIEPSIAPEVRIFQALERYYDIPRRTRFVSLCRQLDHAYVDTPEIVRGLELQHTVARSGLFSEPEPDQHDSEQALEELSEHLCHVDREAQAARLALGWLAPRLERTILFRIKSSSAEPWLTDGLARAGGDDATGVRFSIISEPLFGLLLGNSFYRGPVPDDPACRGFFDRLGVKPPKELLLIPIHVEDRLVAMLYGDGGRASGIMGETSSYRRLAHKLGCSLYLAGLRRQLRSI